MAGNSLFFVVLLALAAGCAGPSTPSTPETEARPATAGEQTEQGDTPIYSQPPDGPKNPQPEVVEELVFKGTIDARTPAAGSENGDDSWLQEIPVDERTTRIEATLAWTSPGEAQDVDLYVSYPGCQEHVGGGCVANWFVAGLLEGAAKVDDGGGPGMPDSPAQVTLDSNEIQARLSCQGFADSCPWRVGVIDEGRTYAVVEFTLVVRITSRAA